MDNPHPNPAPEWLSDQAWSHLCELDTLAEPFNGLRDSLTSSPSEWRAIYDTTKPPHEQPLPGGYSDKLDSFQRLLVLRCILPDKLIPAIQVSRAGRVWKGGVCVCAVCVTHYAKPGPVWGS
jgi:dynein heavy chain